MSEARRWDATRDLADVVSCNPRNSHPRLERSSLPPIGRPDGDTSLARASPFAGGWRHS